MDFVAVVDQAIALLRQRGRVTYRTLKRQFQLDDEALADLKVELIKGQQLATDEDGEVLVWTGDTRAASEPALALPTSVPVSPATGPERDPLSYTPPHLAEKILTSRSALEGERKQVTVLFCDLVNSTLIAERIGAEHMHTLLNRFFALVLDAVHRYEGTINQFLGDGFMALFGAPITHEDHARRAVQAALELQRSLQDHHAELGDPYGVPCAFRMGLNSGLVVVGSIGDNLRMDYSAVGDTTNLAARLQQAAEPDTILIGESTRRLVQAYVRVRAIQPLQVKGKTDPVTSYRVIGTVPHGSPLVARGERPLSAFVGREREVAILHALFAQVEAGQGQVIEIVAEAGGGKSRLLYEFRQRLDDQRVTYVAGRCISYGSRMPYHPIIHVVRQHCGITETDRPEAIVEKVRVALQQVGMDPETSAPYLLQLLGIKEGTGAIAVLTPEAMQMRIFDTLIQMSLHGSQRRPLVLEIEDLHWVDKTSEAYLASLVESLSGAAILLLTTYRPGYRPSWSDKSYATQLSLRPLASQDAVAVVQSNSQQRVLPEQLVQVIVDKADGNPFFLEELTRTVIEHEGLQDEMSVPDTIQGVLMARIDRLPEDAKRLVQMAAVLGREFSPRLLEAIWDEGQRLSPLLIELKRRAFLYERAGAGEPVYGFKHALTQEVAYASLLTPRRQRWHQRVVQALESLYADQLEAHTLEIAHHLMGSGSLVDAKKVAAYARRAGDQAFAACAWSHAARYYEAALVAAESIGPLSAQERAELHYWAGLSHYRNEDVDPCLDHYDHAMTGYRHAGDMRGLAQVLMDKTETQYTLASVPLGTLVDLQPLEEVLEVLNEHEPRLCGRIFAILAQAYRHARQGAKAQAMAQRAFTLGQDLGDDDLCARAGAALGLGYMQSLHVREALDSWHQAVEAARRINNLWLEGCPLARMPLGFVLLGQLEEAETTAFAAYDLARTTHEWGEGASVALSHLASVAVARGDFAATARYTQETRSMVSRSGYPWGGFRALLALACAHALRGAWRDVEAALDLLLEPGQVFHDPGPVVRVVVATFRQLVRAYAEGGHAMVDLQVAEVLQHMHTDSYSLAPLCALVELADLMATPSLAEPPAEALRLAAERGLLFSSGWIFLIPRVLGVAATLGQRWDQAEGYFHAAIATAQDSGTQPELGRTYMDYARMLTARGGPGDQHRAIELLTRARAVFDALEMRPFAQRVQPLIQILQLSC